MAKIFCWRQHKNDTKSQKWLTGKNADIIIFSKSFYWKLLVLLICFYCEKMNSLSFLEIFLSNFQVLWESDHKTWNYWFLKNFVTKKCWLHQLFQKKFLGTFLSYWYALTVKKRTIYSRIILNKFSKFQFYEKVTMKWKIAGTLLKISITFVSEVLEGWNSHKTCKTKFGSHIKKRRPSACAKFFLLQNFARGGKITPHPPSGIGLNYLPGYDVTFDRFSHFF